MKSYARFYASLRALGGETEEMKKQMVKQYTWGRTESLREMTREEYEDCCDALERLSGRKAEQKKLRSRVLNQMQKLGIDTTDWTRVNAFCKDKRIAGKVFGWLNNEELEALSKKLRSIAHRGGLKMREEKKMTEVVMVIPQGGSQAMC